MSVSDLREEIACLLKDIEEGELTPTDLDDVLFSSFDSELSSLLSAVENLKQQAAWNS